MGDHRGQPIDLLLLKGKSHLTKEEVKARRQMEKSLKSGITKIRPNEKVLNNPIARAVFVDLLMLYENIDIVEGLDANVINRYCLLTAEIETQEVLLSRMQDDIDECETAADRVTIYKAIAGAERTLMRTRDMLMKIEDRLFLNPVSRIKNVPKKEEPKPQTEFDKKFGDV